LGLDLDLSLLRRICGLNDYLVTLWWADGLHQPYAAVPLEIQNYGRVGPSVPTRTEQPQHDVRSVHRVADKGGEGVLVDGVLVLQSVHLIPRH